MSGKKNGLLRKTRRLEGSHQKLGENFLARLDRTWQQHGREILDRAMAQAGAFVRDGDLPDHEGWRLGLSMKSLDGASAKRRRLRGAII